ncbi:acyloxyacyl hydrolase [Ruegeria profundi]|uniref:Lipid A 3-O-deacylase n=1 Tax=Ruegeria profundi TaxID=1685378 RepID=A0A0X3U3G0_9RHOB|nr:acyloxyacyl hydrolase [Ruegeria profundi]KUJ81376.1 lipid A 3-O-deacylase [Ruegeria profundi]
MKTLLTTIAFIATAQIAQAQSLVFGAGFADFSSGGAKDRAAFSLEYQHRPFYEIHQIAFAWGISILVDTTGDFYIGAGLVGTYEIADRWFLEGSVMPGFYAFGDEANDLGGDFQIRSLVGVGYSLASGNKVSLALAHLSNASTNDENPGANAIFLRFHKAF